MKKNILICGSIVAVIVLVLVSFTSVVGYQTTKSSSRISPLFSIRMKRATDKESKVLSYDFVGKGVETNLYFPKRDSDVEFFDEIINIIKEMDGRTFDKFVKKVIAHVHQNNEINDIGISDKEIEDMLYQLRDNSEIIKNNFMVIKDKEPTGPTIVINSPECLLAFLILILLRFITVFLTPFIIIVKIIRFIFEIMRETNPSLATFN